MDDLFPHVSLMHCCIITYDASPHQLKQVDTQNAGMHERTREIIRQLMKDNGTPSERQLALDVDMSQTTLNRFMKGDTDSLDFINLQKLAHFYGLTVSQLIGETPFDEDRKIRAVMLAMQQMPDYKKDVLVAASATLAQPEEQTQSNVVNGR